MTNAMLADSKFLAINATASSSAADFDFLHGAHFVHHRKLKTRLANCDEWDEFDGTHFQQPVLNGIGNLEQHQLPGADGKAIVGMALRIFEPISRLWSIYWADSITGVLDKPVRGSFENGIGYFFGEDEFNGSPILLQFKWDATDPNCFVWSQAFSADQGQTWEWNWYMYFTREKKSAVIVGSNVESSATDSIGIIEIRNYLMKKGRRDDFIQYFEENFISSQEGLGGFPLAQYRVKDHEDNFCWIRGFANLPARSKFLPSFYMSDYWKQRRSMANSMIANNDNVHLLQPLKLEGETLSPATSVNKTSFETKNGIVILDFHIANTKRTRLKELFGKSYINLLKQAGFNITSIWESVTEPNDFPVLPVFQDENLVLVISHFASEQAYNSALSKLENEITDELRNEMLDTITTKNTVILVPTAAKHK